MSLQEITVRAGGTDLFVAVEGDGPAFVMLHGGFSTHADPQPLSTSLCDQYTVIRPDIRGHGRSIETNRANHTIDRYADDVVAVLDHLGIGRAAVGGHSLGSFVALATALRHPSRVAAMLLIGIPLAPHRQPTDAQKQLFALLPQLAARIESDGLQGVAKLLPGVDASRLLPHDAASLAGWLRVDSTSFLPITSLDALASLTLPVLLILGSNALHPPEVAELYHAALPNSTVAPPVAPTAAGPGLVDDTAASATGRKAIRDFLDRHRRLFSD